MTKNTNSPVDTSSQLQLHKVKGNQNSFYWTFHLKKEDLGGLYASGKTGEDNNLVMVLSNQEVIGSFMGAALSLSVIGLYATLVVAIGRFIRIIFDRISQRVIYEELPDTEQLFEICEGIFIAQLEDDLVKEKNLYELLIRIYRSPETLLKITEAKGNRSKKHV
jgi:hypothetical protein